MADPKPNDGAWPPLPAHRVAVFLDWLDFQVKRHYAQRATVCEKGGSTEVAYCLKLEAHTYERVRTAFIQVLSGEPPSQVPPR